MAGVLLYTGSPDKEGSLGGLVELGAIEHMIPIMRNAFQEALLCTNDPECLHNQPSGENINGAACHSCCMISETACENGNRMLDRGLVVAEGFDYEIIEKMNRPHDDYTILVTLKADGDVEKTVVGSVVESCILDSEDAAEFSRLREIFEKDSLQRAKFTIKENGYTIPYFREFDLPANKVVFARQNGWLSVYIDDVQVYAKE